MLVHCPVGGSDPFNRSFTNTAIEFSAAFQCGGQTIAGFGDFLSRRVGRGDHQGRAGFGECPQVIADFLDLCVHIFPSFGFVDAFQW